MTVFIELGPKHEAQLRRHAEKLGRSLDSVVSDAIEKLVDEYEAAFESETKRKE